MTKAEEVELMHTGSAKVVNCMSEKQRKDFDVIFIENYNLHYLEVAKKHKEFALADCGLVSLAMYFKRISVEEKTALLEEFKYRELNNGNR